MKQSFPTLYLFNNVFFPQTVIPLTVNDQVSKGILMSCFEDGQHILFYHPSLREKRIGTVGRILLLELNDDESMTVLVQGVTRVKLLTQEQHLPFPVFQAEDYFDQNIQTTVLEDSLERLQVVLETWLERHIVSTKERERFLKEVNTPLRLINNLCLLVLKDLELKEIFLENRSLSERIRMMDALLRGKSPETEDGNMCEAIKNFERLEPDPNLKNAI